MVLAGGASQTAVGVGAGLGSAGAAGEAAAVSRGAGLGVDILAGKAIGSWLAEDLTRRVLPNSSSDEFKGEKNINKIKILSKIDTQRKNLYEWYLKLRRHGAAAAEAVASGRGGHRLHLPHQTCGPGAARRVLIGRARRQLEGAVGADRALHTAVDAVERLHVAALRTAGGAGAVE